MHVVRMETIIALIIYKKWYLDCDWSISEKKCKNSGMVENADYGLRTWTADSDCGLGLRTRTRTADSDCRLGLRTRTADSDCGLGLWTRTQIVDYGWRTTDCGLQIAEKSTYGLHNFVLTKFFLCKNMYFKHNMWYQYLNFFNELLFPTLSNWIVQFAAHAYII